MFWSHHEKIVVIDRYECFIGGLDIALGRDDTVLHELIDTESQEWIGKDYYNPRFKDFYKVSESGMCH